VEMQLSATAGTAGHRSRARQHSVRASFTEGLIILIALYTLLGAGIGSACGALTLGMGFGLAVGVMASAAILLVSGAAQSAKSA
jgi:hypothetical protein